MWRLPEAGSAARGLSRPGLLAAVGAVGLVVAALLQWAGRSSDDGVPTARVEVREFLRRVPVEGHLKAVRATPLSLPSRLRQPMRVAWLVPDGSHVEEGDLVVRFDPTEMEKQLEDARDDVKASDLRIAKSEATARGEIANLDRDADLAAAELANAEQFQKKDELVFSRVEIVESGIDQKLAEERKRHADSARETRERLTEADLDLLRIEKGEASARIDQAKDGLEQLEIRAPHPGIVVLRQSRGTTLRVGDTVFMGSVLAEIPDLHEMEAEVFVLEADAGGVEVGKPAQIRLLSHPDRVVEAEIARVDSVAKPRIWGSPVQYFGVTLKLAATDPEVMKPGQRVEGWLLLDDLEEAKVIPRQAVFDRDGGKVAYRRDGTGFEAVPVELGAVGMGLAVVSAGLEPGDEVALRDPSGPSRSETSPESSVAPAVPLAGGVP